MTDSRAVRLAIGGSVVERFPEVQMAAFVAVDLDPQSPAVAARAADLVLATRAELAACGIDAESIARDPRIRGWRDGAKAMQLKPSAYRSSPEQIARRLLKDVQALGRAIPLVQAYCAVSARHLAPLGAYDLERLPGDAIELRFAREGDRFDPIGGDAGAMPPSPHVAVYAVGDEIVCWGFNYRDSAATGLRATTRAALFVGEAVTAEQHEPLERAIEELQALLRAAGARVGDAIALNAAQPDGVADL